MDLHGDEHGKAVMVRTQETKYVRRLHDRDQLFDLRADPEERVNLIDSPEHQDLRMEMERRLLTWYMETCDVVPHQVDQRGFRANSRI